MLRRLLKKLDLQKTRRYLRLPAPWPVKLEPLLNPTERHVTTATDISSGGISVILPKKFPVKTPVRIEIYIPPVDQTVQAEGEVLRCLPLRASRFELGIQFLKINPKDQATLTKAVERFRKR